MIKLYLKKVFSVISLLFCAVSMVSAYNFTINGITYETNDDCSDLRIRKNGGYIPVNVSEISDAVLKYASKYNNGVIELVTQFTYRGENYYIYFVSKNIINNAFENDVTIEIT